MTIDIVNIIDWTLRFLQIITFLCLIIKVTFTRNNSYTDNLKVEMVKKTYNLISDKRFHIVLNYKHIKDGPNFFLIYPFNTDIRYIKFYEIEFIEINKSFKEKLVHRIDGLKNNFALVVQTSVPDNIPILKMTWETINGEIGEYIFRFNGFNGNTNMSSYQYNLTWKRKILSIFGI